MNGSASVSDRAAGSLRLACHRAGAYAAALQLEQREQRSIRAGLRDPHDPAEPPVMVGPVLDDGPDGRKLLREAIAYFHAERTADCWGEPAIFMVDQNGEPIGAPEHESYLSWLLGGSSHD